MSRARSSRGVKPSGETKKSPLLFIVASPSVAAVDVADGGLMHAKAGRNYILLFSRL
jgi:hypothetical protein